MNDAFGGDAAPVADVAPAPEPVAADAPTGNDPAPQAEAKPDKPASLRDQIAKARDKVAAREEGPARDESGRFTAKPDAEGMPPAPKPPAANGKPAAANAMESAKPAVAAADAPTRFSADARAAWATTPDPVKAEVSRAMAELENGLKGYQQKFEPLKQYFDMAAKANTTVEAALGDYVRLATVFKQNPDQAIAEIFQRTGTDPRAFAAKVLGQPQDQQMQAYQGIARERDALRNELQTLKAEAEQVKQQQAEREEADALRQIEEFKANPSNARFEELSPIMQRLLSTGVATTLPEAYGMADRLNPAPQPVAQPTAPAPQPRKPNLQISGAPSPGSNPAYRKPSNSVRESIERAMSRVG